MWGEGGGGGEGGGRERGGGGGEGGGGEAFLNSEKFFLQLSDHITTLFPGSPCSGGGESYYVRDVKGRLEVDMTLIVRGHVHIVWNL